MAKGILVALGGNALIRPGQRGTIAEQSATLRRSLAGVVELVRLGHQLVITHRNGPQVRRASHEEENFQRSAGFSSPVIWQYSQTLE
jgi:carbamate kinase